MKRTGTIRVMMMVAMLGTGGCARMATKEFWVITPQQQQGINTQVEAMRAAGRDQQSQQDSLREQHRARELRAAQERQENRLRALEDAEQQRRWQELSRPR